jgi:hypothetical protein
MQRSHAVGAAFREATVQALFECAKGERFRQVQLSPGARRAKGELLRLFVDEALTRAAQLAHQEGFKEMHPEHVCSPEPFFKAASCSLRARAAAAPSAALRGRGTD